MTQPQQQQRRQHPALAQNIDDGLFMDDLLEASRAEAARNAVQTATREHDERTLKRSGSGALNDVKDKLREARKPRLRTIEQYLCDGCDAVIASPTEGFVTHGNIYVADPTTLGGLIGNNFPVDGGDINYEKPASEVRKTVLCKRCFLRALGLEQKGDVSAQLTGLIRESRR